MNSFIVSELVQVNTDNSLSGCVNLLIMQALIGWFLYIIYIYMIYI